MEEWRVIPSYPKYEVSNIGNVRNAKNKKIRLQDKQKSGDKFFFRVALHNKSIRVHKLIEEAFGAKEGT